VINLDAPHQVTASDGETRVIGIGEIFLIEDVHGKGHLSPSVGEIPSFGDDTNRLARNMDQAPRDVGFWLKVEASGENKRRPIIVPVSSLGQFACHNGSRSIDARSKPGIKSGIGREV
jgi:hypothetical protein